jgi:Protein of unknown function (DUF2695)
MSGDLVEVVSPRHDRWEEFCGRLAGPQGVNFRHDENGELRWDCDSRDIIYAMRILQQMEFNKASVDASLSYFRDHGGFCDCEILFNVAVDEVIPPI